MTKKSDFSIYTKTDIPTILTQLNTDQSGLSQQEAIQRIIVYGKNELRANQTQWYDILLRQFKSPFLYLLIGAAALSFLLRQFIDGSMILLFVGINALLGFYQEFRSEKTLQLLKKYVVANTKVYRDGQEQTVQSSQLVPGDIVIVKPGDIIPADIRFIKTKSLIVDESLLTGESVAVTKTHESLSAETSQIYKAQNIGFSGTTIVSGDGLGVVLNTGKNTTIGKITALTVETKHESNFEKGISKLSAFILKLIASTLILIVVINILLKGSSVNIPTLIIFAIALAISVIPEALPVVTTFSFSRGALRLAKHNVVVKRLSAIEDLGSIEILCTDKTGTITENKLTVSSFFPEKDGTVLMGALASSITPKGKKPTDSFDIALTESLSKEEQKLFTHYTQLDEAPFDPKRRRNSVLVSNGGKYELIVRGAYESIAPLCKSSLHQSQEEMKKWVEEQGRQGKRVIAIAKRTISEPTDKLIEHEKELELVGLISFVDPLKKTAHAAIKKAERLGIKIKIITGDSKDVAGAIAFQTGLITDPAEVLTGDELDNLPLEKQHEAVSKYSVFARVSPEQKHSIIQLLQEKHSVGFLGEGINDAPALKVANVAIVVQGASDIAREASDIILLNKSLHVIINGITEGREIFGNTAKYINATLASNFGNFYTVAISSLFIPFLPLLPLQILLINLLTDFPMIAIATDNVDSTEIKNPRNYDIKGIALFATIMGIVSSFDDFLFFALFYKISPQVLQTNWFIGSILTELVFIYVVRSKRVFFKASRPALSLIILTIVAAISTLVLPFTRLGQEVFEFTPPTTSHLLIIFLLVLIFFVTTQSVKLMYYKFIDGKK